MKHVFDKASEQNDLLYAPHFQKSHTSTRLLLVNLQKFWKPHDKHNGLESFIDVPSLASDYVK